MRRRGGVCLLGPVTTAGLLAGLLVGCATSGGGAGHSGDGGPSLTGRFPGNVAASGEVKPGSRGHMVFTASSAGGLSCTGEFTSPGGDQTQFVPFTCSNNQNGQAVVTLRDNRNQGSIVLVYDNGGHGRFAFGGLSLGDAFEDDGKAKS